MHRRLCDLLLDAAIAEVSPAELEAILRAAIGLPAQRAAVLASMALEAGPALLASLPQLHVLSTALPPPPTLVVRHLKLSFFPREDAQGDAGSLSVDELPTGHSNTGVPELESVRRAYLSRQRVLKPYP